MSAVAPVPAAVPPASTVVAAAEVTTILGQLDHAVEDALHASSSTAGDFVTLLTSGAAAAAELSLISNQTAAIASAAVTVGLPALWRIISTIKAGHKAQVKVAALHAVATKH